MVGSTERIDGRQTKRHKKEKRKEGREISEKRGPKCLLSLISRIIPPLSRRCSVGLSGVPSGLLLISEEEAEASEKLGFLDAKAIK